jgi:glycosyltransferase involved in cell wall biosynthesis
MSERIPRLSVGLAVFNGEAYLAESIESILAQTFTDFELIISDNASTDSTPAICRDYAAKDSRIRYSRNDTNIGGANNENLTFRLARAELFRWAAHDDIFAPTLFERCIEVLDQNPDVVLCYSAVVEIDQHGKELRVVTSPQVASDTPSARFRFLSKRHAHKCEATYGIVRSAVLGSTRLQLNYTNSDRVLLCELALHGRFHQVPTPLFYKRFHAGNQYQDWRGRMAWFLPDLNQTGKVTFPNWLELFDYFTTVHRVELDRREKALCYAWIAGPWMLRRSLGLARDVVEGVYLSTRSLEQRRKKYALESWQ